MGPITRLRASWVNNNFKGLMGPRTRLKNASRGESKVKGLMGPTTRFMALWGQEKGSGLHRATNKVKAA